MACFQPLLAVDFGLKSDGKHAVHIIPTLGRSLKEYRERYGDKLLLLPCNKCVGCAQDYARAWQCRIMCEYETQKEKGNDSCFLTLTYNNAPDDPHVAVSRLRQFIKDLRNKFGKGLKFFACTERGSLTHRLHHHAIIFGCDFKDKEVLSKRGLNYVYKSKELEKLWSFGFCSIGSLDIASAGYVSKYCDKKKISRTDDGESVIMSRGLGKEFFAKHKQEIFDCDYLYFEGNKFKIPRTFLRWALDDADFYLSCQCIDYKNRKRKVAQAFRYSKGRSVDREEDSVIDINNMKIYQLSKKEVLRDVY